MSDVQTTTSAQAVTPQQPLSPMARIASMFSNADFKEKLAASLDGLGVSPERFLRTTMTALSANPYLVEKCSPMSIGTAVLRAASMRLELDPALAQAYLVPRKGQATLQISYKGRIELARRTGRLLAIDVGDVCENDVKRHVRGTDTVFTVEIPFDKPRGKVIGYYCAAQWKDGGSTVEYMSTEQINDHRDRFSDEWNRNGAKSVWGQHYDAMAKKTVLNKAAKSWPVSVIDDLYNDPEYIDAEVVRPDVTPVQQQISHDPETGEVLDQQPVQQARTSRLTRFVGNKAA